MSSKAASLVDHAKQWAGNYGAFPNGVEGAVLSAPLRVRAAWDDNDADALADLFTDNGSMLFGDEQLKGREQIRGYLTDLFQGPYKGTRLTEKPLDIRLLTEDVALAVTEGGIVLEDETELAPERESRTMWVLVRHGGEWKVASHQNSPTRG